jgi:uncharacterized membrane protein
MSIAIQTRGISMIWQPAFIGIVIFVAVAVFFSLRVQSGTQRVADKTEEELGDNSKVIGSSLPAREPSAES